VLQSVDLVAVAVHHLDFDTHIGGNVFFERFLVQIHNKSVNPSG
jgi:hypothetical protein